MRERGRSGGEIKTFFSDAVKNNQPGQWFLWLLHLPQSKNSVPFASPSRHSKTTNPSRKSMLVFVILGLYLSKKKNTSLSKHFVFGFECRRRLDSELFSTQDNRWRQQYNSRNSNKIIERTQEHNQPQGNSFVTDTTGVMLRRLLNTSVYHEISETPFFHKSRVVLSPEFSQSAKSSWNKNRLLQQSWLTKK